MNERVKRLRRLACAARESEKLAAEDREARDREIEQAEQDGMSIREIGRVCGLAPSTVLGIVVKTTADRQARLARALGQ